MKVNVGPLEVRLVRSMHKTRAQVAVDGRCSLELGHLVFLRDALDKMIEAWDDGPTLTDCSIDLGWQPVMVTTE